MGQFGKQLTSYFLSLCLFLSEYSCAMQKDILVHGRLYATVNYLCFYANIFRWETSVALRWRDVNGLTKEKTALVIPNAIQVSRIQSGIPYITWTYGVTWGPYYMDIWGDVGAGCRGHPRPPKKRGLPKFL
jgi:hypothetical protein